MLAHHSNNPDVLEVRRRQTDVIDLSGLRIVRGLQKRVEAKREAAARAAGHYFAKYAVTGEIIMIPYPSQDAGVEMA